jgi:hypothetical protein
MILVGQEKLLAEPVKSTGGERRAIKLFVAALVLVCLAAVVIAVDRSRSSSNAGCVTVSVPSYTGAVSAEQCGARAAAWCRTAYTSGAQDDLARALRVECPRRGYPPPGAS